MLMQRGRGCVSTDSCPVTCSSPGSFTRTITSHTSSTSKWRKRLWSLFTCHLPPNRSLNLLDIQRLGGGPESVGNLGFWFYQHTEFSSSAGFQDSELTTVIMRQNSCGSKHN